uniref:Uncharacterized protein n=1 Tax=Chromera velia CCMP2878 TaxID=1169474 RepID=A0A0G4ICC2_9ALVE|eukprot:Cvel_13069.t1-p1 / transcript=Cvel_13069.t1 / gene=Cvel_13069 / organism=Chromera_velia_CCMP2878 / gene_product=hypothetical protein / transcript_product=hypothetical protein / location=Cvel_scaffold880:3653-3895(+) / protein_length=81 / sequence_SO=supercontig / SO=protein_coding / is_pseudo=false
MAALDDFEFEFDLPKWCEAEAVRVSIEPSGFTSSMFVATVVARRSFFRLCLSAFGTVDKATGIFSRIVRSGLASQRLDWEG